METMENIGEKFKEVFLLLSVAYDGNAGKAYLKLYDVANNTIRVWYDSSGHKPYLLTNLYPEEIADRYPQVISHPGFDHMEVVKKMDVLRDREIFLTKIVARDPLSIGGSRKSIREILPRTWEARIKYHLCYIYDTQLLPGMFYVIRNGMLERVRISIPLDVKRKVEGIYSEKETVKKAYDWLELFQAPIPFIRRIALDIEVYSPVPDRIPNPKEANYSIIAVAFAANDGFNEVVILKRKHEKEDYIASSSYNVRFFEDEREMLRYVFKVIESYPVVLTFNGDNFDMRYLLHRAKLLGIKDEEIPLHGGRDEVNLKRGVHVDLYRFFNNHAMQVYAFSNKYQETKTLDTISQALINEGKVHIDKPISELSYQELANYCYQDAYLTLKLTTYNNDLVMKLIILLMRISKLPMEDIIRHSISHWIKSLMYFEHRKRGYLIPNPEDIMSMKGKTYTKAIIKGKKYLGAIVIDPLPGVFFNVIVVDFASLYPSVIKRWNLSYETILCPHEECKSNKLFGLPYWVCKKKRGLIAEIVGFLRDFRVFIYKPLAKDPNINETLRKQYDVVQRALKVFINASYGVFGAETFPLYCPPVAESTTALGRYAIYSAIKKSEEEGLVALYGDTDSLFIWNPKREDLSKIIEWARTNLGIDLDIDKKYRYVILSGLKKNYLGVTVEGKLDIKGLVGKKRNTPLFIKELFSDVSHKLSKVEDIGDIDKVLKEIVELVRESYYKLKNKHYSLDELAFRVALTKNLSEYNKTTPQHVKAAKQLKRFGKEIVVGDIISFVKTRGKEGVKAVQLARIDEVDETKYIEYIETTFRQILEALGVNFDELLGTFHIDKFM